MEKIIIKYRHYLLDKYTINFITNLVLVSSCFSPIFPASIMAYFHLLIKAHRAVSVSNLNKATTSVNT